MDSTEVYTGPEPHIEVHKYYAGVVPVAVVLSLVPSPQVTLAL